MKLLDQYRRNKKPSMKKLAMALSVLAFGCALWVVYYSLIRPRNADVNLMPATQPTLNCKITPAAIATSDMVWRDWRIMLSNTSNVDVVITWKSHPLEYLRLELLDENGTSVSQFSFSTHFAPSRGEHNFVLRPGESVEHVIGLKNTLIMGELAPGAYMIEAKFDYPNVISKTSQSKVTIIR